MPIDYEVDAQRNLVDTRVHGHLDFDAATVHLARLARDPQVCAGYVEIVGLDGITELDFSPDSARQMPGHLEALADEKSPIGIIFYASSQFAYGFARQLQLLHDLADLEGLLTVVGTREEALAEATRRSA